MSQIVSVACGLQIRSDRPVAAAAAAAAARQPGTRITASARSGVSGRRSDDFDSGCDPNGYWKSARLAGASRPTMSGLFEHHSQDLFSALSSQLKVLRRTPEHAAVWGSREAGPLLDRAEETGVR
jgi:hypothetical protein